MILAVEIVEGSAEKGDEKVLSVNSVTAQTVNLQPLLLYSDTDDTYSKGSEVRDTVEHVLDISQEATSVSLVQGCDINFRAVSDCVQQRLLAISAEDRDLNSATDMATAGKLGPPIVRMHRSNSSGTLDFNFSGLTLVSSSNFSSVRANACVIRGSWMYEVTLLTAGIQQLGWATLSCPFTNEEGVGDSPDSYAYDGKRVKKWDGTCQPYGQPWVVGDVIGSCIDLDHKSITFFQNGVSLGTAFTDVRTCAPGCAYFPALSLANGEGCDLNFGSYPFRYPVIEYRPLQSPPTLDPNLHQASQGVAQQATYLLSCLRRLVNLTPVHDDSNSPPGAEPHPRTCGAVAHHRPLPAGDEVLTAGVLCEFLGPLLLAGGHLGRERDQSLGLRGGYAVWSSLLPSLLATWHSDPARLPPLLDLLFLGLDTHESQACVPILMESLSHTCRVTVSSSGHTLPPLEVACQLASRSDVAGAWWKGGRFEKDVEGMLTVKRGNGKELEALMPNKAGAQKGAEELGMALGKVRGGNRIGGWT